MMFFLPIDAVVVIVVATLLPLSSAAELSIQAVPYVTNANKPRDLEQRTSPKAALQVEGEEHSSFPPQYKQQSQKTQSYQTLFPNGGGGGGLCDENTCSWLGNTLFTVIAKVQELITRVDALETKNAALTAEVAALKKDTSDCLPTLSKLTDANGTRVCQLRSDTILNVPLSLVVGNVDPTCPYGNSSLSVDYTGAVASALANCPSGNGAVTFGEGSVASEQASAVLGGQLNEATSVGAVVVGGRNNLANGFQSVVVGGDLNTATGSASSILGGSNNTALALLSTVAGGENGIAVNTVSCQENGATCS